MASVKILIIIDVAPRDLKECCLVGYQLMAKYRYQVIFSTTKNEKSEMMRHKPHVLILSHLQYERFDEVVSFAKDMGVKICIMPREGIPAFDETIVSLYGNRRLLSAVDLFLSWGPHVTYHFQKELPQAKIKTVGCARYDTYHQKFRSLFRSREEFFSRYQFNPLLPLLLWGSSWSYFKDDVDITRKKYQDLSELGQQAWSSERILSQRLTFETSMDYMKKFMANNTQVNVAYHPHPLEDPQVIAPLIKAYPSIKVINPFDPLEEALFYSSLYVGFPCPAAVEGWVQNPSRPSIFIRHPDLKIVLQFQNELMACADIASNYEELGAKIKNCLRTEYSTPKEIVRKREEMIERYLFKIDGLAAERCADAIAELVRCKNTSPRWRLKQALYGMSLIKSRLITGHWISLKRPPTHPKYLAPVKVEEWISRICCTYQNSIARDGYQIDV